MNYWKEHAGLRMILMLVTFVLGMVLIIRGWMMTGQMAGLGLMLVGVALIYDGISDLWIVSRLSRSARRFSKNVADHFQSFEDAKDGVVYTAKEQDVTEENMD